MSKIQASVSSPGQQPSDTIYYVILGVIIVCIAALRIRLLDFPLERDEGGFAYMANLMLKGIPPYTEAYDFKPPGLYAVYAFSLFLFGKSPTGIHTGLMIANLGSMVLIFFLARKLFNSATGIIAALVFGILCLSPSMLGFAAHATHFVVFWMLLGYLMLTLALEKNNMLYIVLSGIAFGVSVLIKQPAILFIIFAFVVTIFLNKAEKFNLMRLMKIMGIFLSGIILPLGITGIWLWTTGAFPKFYFWNVTYGLEFGSRISFTEAIPYFMSIIPGVLKSFVYVWILAGIGFILLFTPFVKQHRIELILFTAFSFIAVSIGFQFRSHYFIMLVPALSLCSSIVFFVLSKKTQTKISSLKSSIITAIVILFPVGLGIFANQNYFFTDDTSTLSRNIYFPNTFSESQTIADFVQSRTSENDYIAILVSEPQVPFLAGRRSATRYLFTYFFMEPHPLSLQMEQEMEKEIEQNSPKILILFNDQISWGTRPTSEISIFDWANTYIKNNYDIVGLVDMISPSQIIYKWDKEIRFYPRARDANVLIFERHK